MTDTEPVHEFSCVTCWQTFASSQGLRGHKRIHKVPLLCVACKIHFEDQRSFDQHAIAGHGPRYKCKTCGWLSRDLKGLMLHVVDHEEEPEIKQAKAVILDRIKRAN